MNYIDIKYKDNKKRDFVLVIPGGAYERTSPREGEIVSKHFINNNFHSGVLYYREELLKFPDILVNMHSLITEKLLKNNLINNIYFCGFSAGGHLASLYSCYYKNIVSKLILAYPVISSTKYAHKKSFENLLNSINDLDKVSIDKLVNKDFPKTFIFHTRDDKSVNVKNSLLLFDKLLKYNVESELHIYKKGKHGVSLGIKETSFNDQDPYSFEKEYEYLSNWINLAINFLKE